MNPSNIGPKGWLGLMLKAPALGRVKTRLAATRGHPFALEFSRACLQDVWQLCSGLSERLVTELVVSGQDALPELLPAPCVHFQAQGDLGARMESALRLGLGKAEYAMLLGTDSPSLPRAFILEAVDRLRAGAPSVLGPAEDGGFYLIGVRSCPNGLLGGLPWSQSDTRQRTVAQLTTSGFSPHLLPPWFDVDDESGLTRLIAGLQAEPSGGASHCRHFLESQSKESPLS